MLTCVEDIVVYSIVVIIGAFAMSPLLVHAILNLEWQNKQKIDIVIRA